MVMQCMEACRPIGYAGEGGQHNWHMHSWKRWSETERELPGATGLVVVGMTVWGACVPVHTGGGCTGEDECSGVICVHGGREMLGIVLVSS